MPRMRHPDDRLCPSCEQRYRVSRVARDPEDLVINRLDFDRKAAVDNLYALAAEFDSASIRCPNHPGAVLLVGQRCECGHLREVTTAREFVDYIAPLVRR